MKDFTGRADTLLAGFEDGPAQIRSIPRADAASSSAFPAKNRDGNRPEPQIAFRG